MTKICMNCGKPLQRKATGALFCNCLTAVRDTSNYPGNHKPRNLLDQPTRQAILRLLANKGESFNAEIAKSLVKHTGEIGFDESTVIRDIRKLKLNGYIEEVSHAETDKRKYYVITQKGRDAIATKKNPTDRRHRRRIGWVEKMNIVKKDMKEQNREYDKWKNSVEGVLYELGIIGDRLLDDDEDKTLIAKTLLKLPEEIREKTIDEVLFVIMRACGTVENLKLSKVAKKEEFEFETEKMAKVTIEQPLVILNFGGMKKDSEMDTIAHEIAHFILGHHINQSNPNNETEADDLVEKWGFKRAYGVKTMGWLN